MARTTVDIDDPILRELKELGRREGRPLGKLLTELAAEALRSRRDPRHTPAPRLEWISKAMHSRLDWADSEALAALLDEDDQIKLSGGDRQSPDTREDRANQQDGTAGSTRPE